MEQRPLRLGDIVDDYCPRERRITNHAIVAIVEDSIRQTRCSTCDTEHVYKDGREPKRRRKDPEPTPALAGGPAADSVSRSAALPRAVTAEDNGHADHGRAEAPPAPVAAAPSGGEPVAEEPSAAGADDHWPGHRPLIRATLPRTEGEPPAPRPIPEFTMHQRPQGRGQGFRYAQGWAGHGNGPDRGNGFRPGRPMHGAGRGPGNGQGPSPGPGNGSGIGNGRPAGSRRRRGRHKPPR